VTSSLPSEWSRRHLQSFGLHKLLYCKRNEGQIEMNHWCHTRRDVRRERPTLCVRVRGLTLPVVRSRSSSGRDPIM
jgi:hypothetical protein